MRFRLTLLVLATVFFAALSQNVNAQDDILFSINSAVVQTSDESGNWSGWGERIELDFKGKYQKSNNRITINGERENVYEIIGQGTQEVDEEGNTYISFEGKDPDGVAVEISFLFYADDNSSFLLAVSWSNIMIAYNCID